MGKNYLTTLPRALISEYPTSQESPGTLVLHHMWPWLMHLWDIHLTNNVFFQGMSHSLCIKQHPSDIL